ncbi:hypothetical protein OCAE111667_24080 [Occultella aeris]|uniref:Uncharacterized protein n=1 Tax=Occultella aeris TaxID=2761496 RepID=A0A7M4DEI4_9MICO|nr:hypothetical protein [Occultella aeris]VZO35327.1 hypothetical protein HALOF300_00524 [Occultella aeris]
MGRGGAEEFILDFDEPGRDGDPDVAAPPRRRRDGPDLPRPVALWASVAVLLVVTGILTAPPPPGPGDHRSQVVLPGTTEVVDLPGLGIAAMIDDGSSPSVTIVQSEDFTTVEAMTADGEVLWDAASGWAAVRLGDPVLMSDSTSGARDVRTGEWLFA